MSLGGTGDESETNQIEPALQLRITHSLAARGEREALGRQTPTVTLSHPHTSLLSAGVDRRSRLAPRPLVDALSNPLLARCGRLADVVRLALRRVVIVEEAPLRARRNVSVA